VPPRLRPSTRFQARFPAEIHDLRLPAGDDRLKLACIGVCLDDQKLIKRSDPKGPRN